jgi:hypothetical protein
VTSLSTCASSIWFSDLVLCLFNHLFPSTFTQSAFTIRINELHSQRLPAARTGSRRAAPTSNRYGVEFVVGSNRVSDDAQNSHFELATGITQVFWVSRNVEAFGEWDMFRAALIQLCRRGTMPWADWFSLPTATSLRIFGLALDLTRTLAVVTRQI